MTEGPPAKLYGDVRSKISQGFIVFDEFWAFFKPGDFAALKDRFRNYDISWVEFVKLGKNIASGPKFWRIKLMKIAWKGGQFRRVFTQRQMESFTALRKSWIFKFVRSGVARLVIS